MLPGRWNPYLSLTSTRLDWRLSRAATRGSSGAFTGTRASRGSCRKTRPTNHVPSSRSTSCAPCPAAGLHLQRPTALRSATVSSTCPTAEATRESRYFIRRAALLSKNGCGESSRSRTSSERNTRTSWGSAAQTSCSRGPLVTASHLKFNTARSPQMLGGTGTNPIVGSILLTSGCSVTRVSNSSYAQTAP